MFPWFYFLQIGFLPMPREIYNLYEAGEVTLTLTLTLTPALTLTLTLILTVQLPARDCAVTLTEP